MGPCFSFPYGTCPQFGSRLISVMSLHHTPCMFLCHAFVAR